MDLQRWARTRLRDWDEASRAAVLALVADLPPVGRDAVTTEVERVAARKSSPNAVLALSDDLRALSPEKVDGFLATRHRMTPEQQLTWREELTTVPGELIERYRGAVSNLDAGARAGVRRAVDASADPELLLDTMALIDDPQTRCAWGTRAAELDGPALARAATSISRAQGMWRTVVAQNDPAVVAALPAFQKPGFAPDIELNARLAYIRQFAPPEIRSMAPQALAHLVSEDWPSEIRVAERLHLEALPELFQTLT